MAPAMRRSPPAPCKILAHSNNRGMLIPQFSLRWLLAVTTVAAVVFSIVALGVRGHHWAVAVSVGLLALVILMGIYGVMFAVVWAFSVATSRWRNRRAGSPFASAPAAEHVNVGSRPPWLV